VLANILRTDANAHRSLPADTELAQAIAVLARAGHDSHGSASKPPTNLDLDRFCANIFRLQSKIKGSER
jgi:hypothetical protein